VAALNEAIRLISQLGKASFIQIKGKFSAVTENLRKMEHLKEFPTYGPIIESLMAVGVETDSSTIKEILKLLRKLRERINDSQRAAASLEG
jgi:translation elongation factor EF-Tu-like GTPase